MSREFMFGYPAYEDRLTGKLTHKRGHVLSIAPRSHIFICGSARSGKGAASIAPNALRYSGNLICYDPKLENTWISAEYRARALGQRVVVLDPHGELERQYVAKSSGPSFPLDLVQNFNPMLEVDPGSDDYDATLTDIADAIVDREQAQKDPHWDDRALEALIGVSADCIETGDCSLAAIRARLMLDRESFVAMVHRAMERAPRIAGRHSAGYYLQSFLDDNKEMQGIFSTARRHTKFLDDWAMVRHMNGSANSFRLRDLARKPMTLYLGLPPDKLDAYYPRWVRLMLILTIRAILRERPRDRVLFLIDEFATALGRIPIVERQFGLGAGLGLILVPYVQSLAQLANVYGPGWESFLGNASLKQFFGCGDQFTAEYISRLLGSYRRKTINQSFSLQGSSVNVGETWEPLMRPEAVRRFLAHTSIVFSEEVPYRVKPMFYFIEPYFAGRFRTPPEYAPIWDKEKSPPFAECGPPGPEPTEPEPTGMGDSRTAQPGPDRSQHESSEAGQSGPETSGFGSSGPGSPDFGAPEPPPYRPSGGEKFLL